MSKRKFKKGKLVTSIDELFEHRHFIVQYGGFTSPERTVHFGFVQSWQVRMANLFVRGKRVWVAERLTNGEFYSNMTDKEIVDKFDEELCAYCPLPEERRGYAKVNRLMSEGRWREVLGVYPGFLGAKRQRPGSRQPILTYPAPRGRYRGVAGGR